MFKDISKIGLAIIKEGSKSVALSAGVAVTSITVGTVVNSVKDGKFGLDVLKDIKFDLNDLI